MISRRDFLLSGSATVALSSLLTSIMPFQSARAFANPPLDRFFFLIRISPTGGGMDVTLGLDPWIDPIRPDPSDIFLEYQANEVIQAGNLFLGPAAASLKVHAQDLVIINGLMMSEFDNGHEAAMNYMSTGNGQGRAADLPAEIGLTTQLGEYGVLASDQLMLANRVVPYMQVQDILSARSAQDPGEFLDGARVHLPSPIERAAQDIVRNQALTKRLMAQLKIFSDAGIDLSSESEMGAVVAACFLSGAVRQAKTDFWFGNLDSHSNHEKLHLAGQTSAWEQVAHIFKFFKSLPYGNRGASLFDHTLFMVISDFARTPSLNGARGKDHNPMTNSVLLAGAGLKKNTVINKSLLIEAQRSKIGASYHMASPFDFATGQPATSRQGADFIYPENLALTVAMAMGADLSQFQSVPTGTKVIPGILV